MTPFPSDPLKSYAKRQELLDEAGPAWRFRIAVERFERAIRNVEAHIHRHPDAPLPDALWAEEQVARRELMTLSPFPSDPLRDDGDVM